MTIEVNKQLITDFWTSFSAADREKAAQLLAENVQWRVMGVNGNLPMSGVMNKAGILELITNVKSIIPNGLAFKMHGFTSEGNRVANEAESYGELTNGRIYKNLYHFLIEIEDGKIALIKEYMDTIHVKEILVD